MRNFTPFVLLIAIFAAILSCGGSKQFTSQFGYRLKLANWHDNAEQFYLDESYSKAIPLYEKLIMADSTFIYPEDRLLLHKCYTSLSRFGAADALLNRTLASVSKMKDKDSKVKFPPEFEKLLNNYEARLIQKTRIPEWNKKQQLSDSTFIVAYDTPPQPVGGFTAIQKNLVYPEKPRKQHIEGVTTIQALIGENGTVVDARVLVSLEESCDQSAINAIKSVKWIPATKDGKPVQVWVSIPVRFKLK